MTKGGIADLQKELDERTSTIRKQLQDDLDEMLSTGDLSENASYYNIQEEIASNDKRIQELTEILEQVIVATEDGTGDKNGKADIGNSIIIEVNGKKVTYELVGTTEADPKKNRISIDSPIGKALLGKKPGDTATVKTPLGDQKYAILSVK